MTHKTGVRIVKGAGTLIRFLTSPSVVLITTMRGCVCSAHSTELPHHITIYNNSKEHYGKSNHSKLLSRHHGRYPSPVSPSMSPSSFQRQNMLTKQTPTTSPIDQTNASKWHTSTLTNTNDSNPLPLRHILTL